MLATARAAAVNSQNDGSRSHALNLSWPCARPYDLRHLFDELADAPNTSAEDLIRAARAQEGVREVSVLCPRPPADPHADPEDPCKSEKPSWGLEPQTPSLPLTPGSETADHERACGGTFDPQMRLFDPDAPDGA